MVFKKKKICYDALVRKIDSMDSKICEMRKGLSTLKQSLLAEKEEEEICPDEVESEIALLDAIQDICLEGLLEREPEGDA